jgi:hypothetical protein
MENMGRSPRGSEFKKIIGCSIELNPSPFAAFPGWPDDRQFLLFSNRTSAQTSSPAAFAGSQSLNQSGAIST